MRSPKKWLEYLTEASVVQIVPDPIQGGTGFFVAPGKIITCAHVVAVSTNATTDPIRVIDQEGRVLVGQVRAIPARMGSGTLWDYPDICLISLTNPPADHRMVILGDVHDDADVSLSGYSDIYQPRSLGTRRGHIGGTESLNAGRALRIVGCEMPPGLSGGPVLDLNRGVVRAVAKTRRRENTEMGGLAIPAGAISDAFHDVWEMNQSNRDQDGQWMALQDALRDGVDSSQYGLTHSEWLALTKAAERFEYGSTKLTQLWQKVVGPHIPRPNQPFEQMRDVIADLSDRQMLGLDPLIKLFEVLADLCDGARETGLRGHASKAAARNAQTAELGEYRAGREGRNRPVVVIRLEPDDLNPKDEVRLSAWSYPAWNGPGRLVTGDREGGPYPLGKVKETILTVLDHEIGTWPTMIQLVLPDHMLDEAVERWKLSRFPVGVEHPVIVRFAQWPENESEARRAQKRMRSRQEGFESLAMPADSASWDAHWVDCADQRTDMEIYAMLNSADRPPFVAMTAWHKGDPLPMPVDVARLAGVPVIVWRHKPCSGCVLPTDADGICPGAQFRAEATKYLSGVPFSSLPEKIWSVRTEAAKNGDSDLGQGVTILWDEPGRLPWNDPLPIQSPAQLQEQEQEQRGSAAMNNWHIYRQTGDQHDRIADLPDPPSWRAYQDRKMTPAARDDAGWTHADLARGKSYRPDAGVLNEVNAALYLRRPLLVTGAPGVGKSGLAYSVAWQLRLGPVLRWPITSGSMLKDGLYSYDAIGRLRDVNLNPPHGTGNRTPDGPDGDDAGIPDGRTQIERYLTVGPLGTALLPTDTPRVLLIDEIDKASIDLPNDLLSIFEEGRYEIPELIRIASVEPKVELPTADGVWREKIEHGQVRCAQFPLVVMTSNGERDFPAAFLRRCIRLRIKPPEHQQLVDMVRAHLGGDLIDQANDLIGMFEERAREGDLANDQLLNAIHLLKAVRPTQDLTEREQSELTTLLFKYLNEPD
jgi:MoxR-like ATPase